MSNIFAKLKSGVGVGILFLTGVAIMVYASVRLTSSRLGGTEDTYIISALVGDSAGLTAGTSVRSAGIKIGVIDSITLENRQAKIKMQILDSVKLYKNASLGIKSLGILGDKYIDIDQGSFTHDLLQDGDMIIVFRDVGNIDQMLTSINDILKDLNSVTSSLNNSLGGSEGEKRLNNIADNIAEVSNYLNSTLAALDKRIENITYNLDRTLQNTGDFSATLKDTLAKNQKDLTAISQNLSSITDALNKDLPPLAGDLRGMFSENRESLKASLDNLRQASDTLSKSLTNIEASTKKIQQGEGVIGHLINDNQSAQKVTDIISGLDRFLAEANRLKLDLGFRMEYQPRIEEFKGYLSLYYIPSRNHYFMFQVVKDPRGRVVQKSENITTTTAGSTETTEKITETKSDDYLLSLQLAQRYYDSLLRFGMFEGKIGMGIDQYFGSLEQYQLTLEGFDFERSDAEGPHYRILGSWRFLGNAYLALGIDDFANRQDEYRQAFLGIGLNFNRDSLKLLGYSLPLGDLVGQ